MRRTLIFQLIPCPIRPFSVNLHGFNATQSHSLSTSITKIWHIWRLVQVRSRFDFFRENGAAVVKKNSSKSKKRDSNGNQILTHVRLVCDRYHSRRSIALVREMASSNQIDCPFKIVAKCNKKTFYTWMYEVGVDYHNHEPSNDPSCHSAYRKRTEEDRQLIREMMKGGSTVREILNSLKANAPTKTVFQLKDIYNQQSRIRREGHPVLKTTQLWILLLQSKGCRYVSKFTAADDKCLQGIFWTYPWVRHSMSGFQRLSDLML